MGSVRPPATARPGGCDACCVMMPMMQPGLVGAQWFTAGDPADLRRWRCGCHAAPRYPGTPGLSFDGAQGEALDEAAEEDVVEQGHRDRDDDRRRHERLPVEHVATDEDGWH